MTIDEAKIFFPMDQDEDVEEVYENRIFEYKQFFLSKVPIRKVFESKLDKLSKMQEAYEVITGNFNTEIREVLNEDVSYSDKVSEAFLLFEKNKTHFKQQLMMASDAYQIIIAVNQYLTIVDAYRQKWDVGEDVDVEIEQMSKDADPMEVLAAIRSFESEGGVYFSDILQMKHNTFLLNEMKRLSLLSKKYGNGRSV